MLAPVGSGEEEGCGGDDEEESGCEEDEHGCGWGFMKVVSRVNGTGGFLFGIWSVM
jgi:hypothetical protein